jgi:hypothetical protein
MSTAVSVVDEHALKAAIAAVRMDAEPEDWCMADHNGKPNEIKVGPGRTNTNRCAFATV